jgi:hypothetical protein
MAWPAICRLCLLRLHFAAEEKLTGWIRKLAKTKSDPAPERSLMSIGQNINHRFVFFFPFYAQECEEPCLTLGFLRIIGLSIGANP